MAGRPWAVRLCGNRSRSLRFRYCVGPPPSVSSGGGRSVVVGRPLGTSSHPDTPSCSCIAACCKRPRAYEFLGPLTANCDDFLSIELMVFYLMLSRIGPAELKGNRPCRHEGFSGIHSTNESQVSDYKHPVIVLARVFFILQPLLP